MIMQKHSKIAFYYDFYRLMWVEMFSLYNKEGKMTHDKLDITSL